MAMVNKERREEVWRERERERGSEEGREGREGEPFLFLIRWREREGERKKQLTLAHLLVYSATSLDGREWDVIC